MKLSKEEVKNVLPHRDPFLFVDEIIGVTTNLDTIEEPKDLLDSIVHAKYTTVEDHMVFKGHFPGRPIFPGVIQIEMMAQVTSFSLTLLYKDLADRDFDVALLSVEGAKFRKPVFPGMTLDIETKCTKIRKGFLQNDCKVFHEGELVSQATVLASFKVI